MVNFRFPESVTMSHLRSSLCMAGKGWLRVWLHKN